MVLSADMQATINNMDRPNFQAMSDAELEQFQFAMQRERDKYVSVLLAAQREYDRREDERARARAAQPPDPRDQHIGFDLNR